MGCTIFRSLTRKSLSSITSVSLLLATALFIGCGGGESGAGITTAPAGTAPTIATQPASATVPLGSTVSVSVVANGTAPLSYQWNNNGSAIPGASNPTYTISPLAAANSDEKLTVTVANAFGSVTSNAAVITLGPRSPDPRDMRFKHVGLTGTVTSTLVSNIFASVPGNHSIYTTNGGTTLGSVLGIGNESCTSFTPPGNCAWGFAIAQPPSGVAGFNTQYTSDEISSLISDLAALATQKNQVLTTLDEQPGLGIFAASIEEDPTFSSGFTLHFSTVSDSSLQDAVQDMAAQGIVVTAASVSSSSGIDLVGYGWAGDQGRVYDAQSVVTTYEKVGVDAQDLSAKGYILTAVGTADNNQLVLVGTKVKGDTLARPIGGSIGPAYANAVRVGYTLGSSTPLPTLPATSVALYQ